MTRPWRFLMALAICLCPLLSACGQAQEDVGPEAHTTRPPPAEPAPFRPPTDLPEPVPPENMPRSDDPVALIRTSAGDIWVQLFKRQAPTTVQTFLDLAEGRRDWLDPRRGTWTRQPLYDGTSFHRVIANFMIQGGDPTGSGGGDIGFTFNDEISASYLGLDSEPAFPNPSQVVPLSPAPRQLQQQAAILHNAVHDYLRSTFNPNDPTLAGYRKFLQAVIIPEFKALGLGTGVSAMTRDEFLDKRPELIERLGRLSVRQALERLGYAFDDSLESTKPVRGTLAMANRGPNTNSSQFFINVNDSSYLTGKHTVFGRVLKGMDVADAISRTPVHPSSYRPLRPQIIYSIREWPR